MSSRAISCLLITCDSCGAQHEWEDDRPYHWTSRQEAATSEGEADGDWEIPADADGPDLCASCICTRDGHSWSDPIGSDGDTIQFCNRCGRSRDASAVTS